MKNENKKNNRLRKWWWALPVLLFIIWSGVQYFAKAKLEESLSKIPELSYGHLSLDWRFHQLNVAKLNYRDTSLHRQIQGEVVLAGWHWLDWWRDGVVRFDLLQLQEGKM
ncbi:MAG: hypothetical protein AAFP02_22960, partial [Bacteroidota bacterium]